MTPLQPPEDARRFFSLADAGRMLPLVSRIVGDIVAHYQKLEPIASRYRTLSPAERAGARGRELKTEVEERTEHLNGLIDELHELGCHLKGFESGLVDWYSLYAGRPVLLCWKLGEPAIDWWHQIDAGFAGRQRILPSQREAFRGR